MHLARQVGPDGRTVAIKRLHPQFLKDDDFVTMFMDEARIATRIVHPNVVRVLEILHSSRGLFLVMDYVHGETLSRLLRFARTVHEPVPAALVARIVHDALLGLHAAHETRGDHGELLDVVHRDVSPQNIVVGADGRASVLDFGVAKAAGRAQVTREGQIKGKLAYMSPEQIRGQVDRRTDVFAASVVLWEALTQRRLHEGKKDVEIVTRIVKGDYDPPSLHAPVPPALDAIVLRGLSAEPEGRFASAAEMAAAMAEVGLASEDAVGAWVRRLAGPLLEGRTERLALLEELARDLRPSHSTPPSGSETPSDRWAEAPFRGSTPSMTGSVPSGERRSGLHAAETLSAPITTPGLPLARPPKAAPAGTRNASLVWVVVLACAILAIIGTLLGGYALLWPVPPR